MAAVESNLVAKKPPPRRIVVGPGIQAPLTSPPDTRHNNGAVPSPVPAPQKKTKGSVKKKKQSPKSIDLASAQLAEASTNSGAAASSSGAQCHVTRPAPCSTTVQPSYLSQLQSSSSSTYSHDASMTPSSACVSKQREPVFAEHVSKDEAIAGIEDGKLFSARFRVNAHNRFEAYVSIPGVSVDAILQGMKAHNRACEGDTVAVEMDDPSMWPRRKGVREGGGAEETFTGFSFLPPDGDIVPSPRAGPSDVTTNLEGTFSQLELDSPATQVHTGGCAKQRAVQEINRALEDNPGCRPSARVVCVLEHSPLRRKLVGLLQLPRGFGVPNGQQLNGSRQNQDHLDRDDAQGPAGGSNGHEGNSSSSAGSLGSKDARKPLNATFLPRDPKFCRMTVVLRALPRDLQLKIESQASTGARLLFGGALFRWDADSPVPLCDLTRCFGEALDRESEMKSIFFQFGLGGCDGAGGFTDKVLAEGHRLVRDGMASCALLRSPEPVKIGEKEGGKKKKKKKEKSKGGPDGETGTAAAGVASTGQQEMLPRKDLRHLRVLTIDPPTAKDLDDALSVERLANGNVTIGVHIADVAHFLEDGGAVDVEAQERCTSAYFPDRVIPMLPPALCEQACSLKPGSDKLAFSVMWEMEYSEGHSNRTEKGGGGEEGEGGHRGGASGAPSSTPAGCRVGRVVRQWMGRSLIRSRCQLAYDHVQEMIEGRFEEGPIAESGEQMTSAATGKKGDKWWLKGLFRPTLYEEASWNGLIADVFTLREVAAELRRRRFSVGAIHLHNTKMRILLDEDGTPAGVAPVHQKESNRIVEEFMLLANMSVARTLHRAFPSQCVLRRHPPPDEVKASEFVQTCYTVLGDPAAALPGQQGVPLSQQYGALPGHRATDALFWQEEFKRVLLRVESADVASASAEEAQIPSVLSALAGKYMQAAEYFCPGELGWDPSTQGNETGVGTRALAEGKDCGGVLGGAGIVDVLGTVEGLAETVAPQHPSLTRAFFHGLDIPHGWDRRWGHYALSVPFYTHFTSPIRRYADVMVHRQLAIALAIEDEIRKRWRDETAADLDGNAATSGGPSATSVSKSVMPAAEGQQQPVDGLEGGVYSGVNADTAMAKLAWVKKVRKRLKKRYRLVSIEEASKMTGRCNERRNSCKQAQETSERLYLGLWLRKMGEVAVPACVASLGSQYATIFLLHLGLTLQLNFADVFGVKAEWFRKLSTVVLQCSKPPLRTVCSHLVLGLPEHKGAAERDTGGTEPHEKMHEEDGAALGLERVTFPVVVRTFHTVPVILSVDDSEGYMHFVSQLYA